MKYNPHQAAFEQKLDEYIAQSGLNKTWIASKLGYHKSALSKWINGEAQIPLDVLKKLCQLFRLERDQCLELLKLAGYEDVLAFMEDDASIFYSFNHKSGALRRHIRVQEFQSLVDERTRDFVGRRFVFQAIDDLLVKSQSGGYIVVQGEPGIGKTALMAQLVKQRGYVHHFNIAIQNIRSARDFLANICAQLIVKYELAHPTLPPEAAQDSGFLVQLLTETVEKAAKQPVVILVDALDEVEDKGLPDDANRLLLPSALPQGVFFIVTTREQADCRLVVDRREDIYLRDDDPRNLEDIEQYIRDYVQKYPSETAARIAEWGISAETFVEAMVEKSQGNFMYLVQVLRDICAGKLTAATVDNVYQLPQGLRGYYQRHWRLMRAQDEARFEKYYEPAVCYLATAREPVNMEQLVEWTKLPRRQIKEVINEWREFLNVEPGPQGEPLFHVYHASFQDFLKEEVGLDRYHDRIAQNALDKISNF
jgi:transcriptional regulator with XRE-family HTH domain